MARRAPAEILAIGMVTPVGLSAGQTAASVRAGIGRLGESYVTDQFGEALVMGLVDDEQLPPLAEELEDRSLSLRQERLARMGGPALREALASTPSAPLPLLLGIPEPRKEDRHPIGPEMIEVLSAQTGLVFDRACSATYPLGRAAGLAALDHAMDLLDRGRAPAVVVGGVDSYLDAGLLDALDREGRLKTGGVTDGFVPGEAAAFLLVAPIRPIRPTGLLRQYGSPPIARIDGVTRARERGHLYSDEPHLGEGLASACRVLLGGESPRDRSAKVDCVYAGLNGESYWSKEWGVAQIRCADRLAASLRIEHPADCFGDVGAALGLVMLGLGALELARGRIDGSCLVWSAADREDRVVALLSR